MSATPPSRREHRNIGLKDLLPYVARFPGPAWVSLLHRVSGLLLFALLPLLIWAFDASMSSEASFEQFAGVFNHGYGFLPGWLLKLTCLAIVWAYMHHLIAGLRFLMLDVNHSAAERYRAARSARWVLILSLTLTALLGAKIFGFY